MPKNVSKPAVFPLPYGIQDKYVRPRNTQTEMHVCCPLVSDMRC